MNIASRLFTSIILIILGVYLVWLSIYILWILIYAIPILIIAFYILFNKNEDKIERRKDEQ